MSQNKKEPMNNNRIKEVRLLKHKTQKDLAKLLGVSEQAIAYYEKALREPPLKSWVKLADYLGVSVSYLQGISDFPSMNDFFKDQSTTKRNKFVHSPSSEITEKDIENLKKELEKWGENAKAYTDDDKIKKYLSLSNFITNNLLERSEKLFITKWEKQAKNREDFSEFVTIIHHIFRMFILSASNYDETSRTYFDQLKKIVKEYDKKENSYFDY